MSLKRVIALNVVRNGKSTGETVYATSKDTGEKYTYEGKEYTRKEYSLIDNKVTDTYCMQIGDSKIFFVNEEEPKVKEN